MVHSHLTLTVTKISLDTDDFIIEFDIQDGFTFSKRNSLIGIISTARNEELMAKGLGQGSCQKAAGTKKGTGL